MRRRLTRVVVAPAVLAGMLSVHPSAQTSSRRLAGPATTDAVLTAWLAGEDDAISRQFKTSVDFQNRLKLSEPRELERWLGAFDQGKAVFVLALAQVSADVARQYTHILLNSGGRYVDQPSRGNQGSAATPEFLRDWHRAAAGLLQGLHNHTELDAQVKAIEDRGRSDIASDGRLVLARAIAQELRCWNDRPALDQPELRLDALAKKAGVIVKQDLDGPTKAVRTQLENKHTACLDDGVSRFDAARAKDESRAEAGVRGGWLMIQQGRYADALAWLDPAAPGSDRVLGYWRSLFRGRALSGLGRHADAADAYRDAFTRFPGAQSAGIGLAFELLCLSRDAEADQVARSLRATASTAVDPWTTYLEADRRFTDDIIEQLRRKVAG